MAYRVSERQLFEVSPPLKHPSKMGIIWESLGNYSGILKDVNQPRFSLNILSFLSNIYCFWKVLYNFAVETLADEQN